MSNVDTPQVQVAQVGRGRTRGRSRFEGEKEEEGAKETGIYAGSRTGFTS